MRDWFRRWWHFLWSDPQADYEQGKALLERRLEPRFHALRGTKEEEILKRMYGDSPENSPEDVRPDSRKLK